MTWAAASHRAARVLEMEGRKRALQDALAEVELLRRSLKRQLEVVESEHDRLRESPSDPTLK